MSEKKYKIVPLANSSEVNEILKELETAEYVSFDIETNSVIEKTARVIGIGLTYYVDEGFYFPFCSFDVTKDQLLDLNSLAIEQEFVKKLCKVLKNKKLIMHNGIFDIVTILHSYGIDLTDALYADTILMKHTVDEERPFGLKEVAEQFKLKIGFTSEEAANQEQMELKESVIANGGKWLKTQKDMYKGDMPIIGKYCCADVDLTLKLFEYFDTRLQQEELKEFFYNQEVMPLYKKATIPMKVGGVFVDVDYFKVLEKEVERDILKLTSSIFDLISKDIEPFVKKVLDDDIKETKTGRFAEGVLQHYSIPIPVNRRTEKPTLAKNALQSLRTSYPGHPAIEWLLASENEKGVALPKEIIYLVKRQLFVNANPDLPHVFNLGSNNHIAWLLFDCYKQEPKSYSRKTAKPQVNKETIEAYSDLPFVAKLLELKKAEKLLSTYIKPILENNIEGRIYPSMLQFGTTSGRYSCAGGLNLQTLPRDDKRIKRGFIAPPGYKVVNADFSSLEPRVFSWVCNDPGLKRVWLEGLDLYSQIAIDVFGLKGVSARETDSNYLKKKDPDSRQKSKVFTLAVPYGANEWRIAGIAKVPPEEAREWINNYLESYPELKEYMINQEVEARTRGVVRTQFGRVRHLPKAKELYEKFGQQLYNKKSMQKRLGENLGSLIYYEYRNQLNNAKNFPIQATAAHIANASLIKLSDLFKRNKINGWIALQIHDEITCIIKDNQAELAARLLKECMEDNQITNQIDIPITAEPLIASNFADAK